MVSLNYGKHNINVFKKKFKTTYDKHQYEMTNNLWIEIQTNVIQCKHQCELLRLELLDYDEPFDEFKLATIRAFVQENASKIETLIDLNVKYCIVSDSMRVNREKLGSTCENELYLNKILFNWEIIFLNIDFNLFYVRVYVKALLDNRNHGPRRNGALEFDDVSYSDSNLMTELQEFFKIHEIKADLLSKRDCVFNLKMRLMNYRTNLALNLNPFADSRTVSLSELKLNQSKLLEYVYQLGKEINTLGQAENDLDFELNLLKLVNVDHFKALEKQFDNNNKNNHQDLSFSIQSGNGSLDCCQSMLADDVEINLNSQQFYDRIRDYDFKSKYSLFFRTFFIKKENEFLKKLNHELKCKLLEKN